jgi:hypothetical protein
MGFVPNPIRIPRSFQQNGGLTAQKAIVLSLGSPNVRGALSDGLEVWVFMTVLPEGSAFPATGFPCQLLASGSISSLPGRAEWTEGV